MATQSIARSESVAAFVPELERLIPEVMEEWKVPGLAVAVVQNGEVALFRAYGLRDVEAGLKVTTDTQFPIASVTKSFTATGLALLVDERRMDWKKPVREYIPEFRLHGAVATAHHGARFALPRDLVALAKDGGRSAPGQSVPAASLVGPGLHLNLQ